MWQKERLLNIALEVVPDKVEDLAWSDCDLVFESPDWPEAARRALKSDNVIQLFSEVRYLDKSSTDKLEFNSIPDLLRSSAGSKGSFYQSTRGRLTPAALRFAAQKNFEKASTSVFRDNENDVVCEARRVQPSDRVSAEEPQASTWLPHASERPQLIAISVGRD
jgi:hypothetical protein